MPLHTSEKFVHKWQKIFRTFLRLWEHWFQIFKSLKHLTAKCGFRSFLVLK